MEHGKFYLNLSNSNLQIAPGQGYGKIPLSFKNVNSCQGIKPIMYRCLQICLLLNEVMLELKGNSGIIRPGLLFTCFVNYSYI